MRMSLTVACRRSTRNKCSASFERWRVNQKHILVRWRVTQDSSTQFGIWTSQENAICNSKKILCEFTSSDSEVSGCVETLKYAGFIHKAPCTDFITLSSATHTCRD